MSHTKLLVKRNSGISGLSDLNGKVIALPINSVPERLIRSLIEKEKLKIRVLLVKDNSEGFLDLSTGRADAFSTDDILLFGLKHRSQNTSEYEVVGKPLSSDSYGFLVEKHSTDFLSLVTEIITWM